MKGGTGGKAEKKLGGLESLLGHLSLGTKCYRNLATETQKKKKGKKTKENVSKTTENSSKSPQPTQHRGPQEKRYSTEKRKKRGKTILT